ncbi:RNA polymerase sigma factor [Aureibacter tunicatorum]|uniref:RNA polymerase sigma factor n=1 Tax=Aureibacter tunicatorum TaxID=866807 RepID=A0AAE3XNS6_9BACT|nr:RNA polymerase sigma-70 factor [Aureibacter tunicatorum]MDR6240347.1 RNA polymerase sigma-70 factor (ECF subfamily) [Aureibacter tunicatorum]
MEKNKQTVELKDFKQIFDQYYAPIRNFVYYKIKDMDAAEDIAQEVFVKAWEKRDELRMETVKSYLYTIANNLSINHAKHGNVVMNFINKFTHRSNAESPEYIMELKEFDQRLQNAISGLPEKSRTVFLMNRIDKQTYSEIAVSLDISVKAVEKRMSKALAMLKEKLNVKI